MIPYYVMAESDAVQAPLEPESEIEPTRILIPSPLGSLGFELTGELVSQVVIVPKGRARKKFRPFKDLKRNERNDFIDEVVGRFSEFLAGARRSLELDYDLRALGVTGFARRILKQTAKVSYGRTRTYREIASAAGNPEGYRQVLSTLMINPLPLVIPCHRIVTSKSGVGSYIGGEKKKTWLLRMEREALAAETEDR